MRENDIPIACTLDERGLAERERRDRPLLDRIENVRELDDGYELTFPGDDDTVRAVTEFVISERECCRFFTIELGFSPDHGPVHLRLRGPEGARQLLAESNYFPAG